MTTPTSEPSAPEYISYSSFSTLTECAWKYYLTRIKKVDEPPAVYFAGGTAFHSACDAFDYQWIADQEVPF